jgi:hypothetical protein
MNPERSLLAFGLSALTRKGASSEDNARLTQKMFLLWNESGVLATWDIRSGNKHFENDFFFFFHCLHSRADKGKIRSRQAMFMLEQRQPNFMKAKLFCGLCSSPSLAVHPSSVKSGEQREASS